MNHQNGLNMAGGAGTYQFVLGEREIPRKDLKVEGLDLRALLSYIEVRSDIIAKHKDECHLRVDEETATVSLRIFECGGHRSGEAFYTPATELHASARESKQYKAVQELVGRTYSPADLAEALYQVPYLFEDDAHYLAVVKDLRGLVATVTSVQQDTTNDNGTDREKRMKNLITGVPDIDIQLSFQFYVGEPKSRVTFKLFYSVQGISVTIRMRNPRLEGMEDEARKDMIEKFLKEVHAIGTAHASNWRIPVLYGDDSGQ